MADTPLVKKLQLKNGQSMVVLEAPNGYYEHLVSLLPDVACTTAAIGDFDAVFMFAQWAEDLVMHVRTAVKLLKPEAIFWIAYPKQTGDVETDLTRDIGWGILNRLGWAPVRQISLDDTWSVLRFRPANEDAKKVDAQYPDAKAKLRPIYDQLAELATSLGSDVTLNVRKSYVAFVRTKQFALIQPTTKTRVDLGLKLKGKPTTERFKEAKNFGSGSITHKVGLTSRKDIDDEIIAWMQEAYDQQQ
ncbi:MAG: hypothetical protein DWQ04_21555 [Chloroflexi bacterium]|nr:MAG: hypothetical protein DWQ04_21555 [Chloroflexota bacterium]